jgi:hypothetical protein
MPHFEPDKESVYRATELSSRLMKDLRRVSEEGSSEMGRELFSQKQYDEQVYGAPIIDVVRNISQMAVEFAMIRRWDYKVLCLKLDDGEVAPIAMTGFWGSADSSLGSGLEDWFEVWQRWLPGSYLRDIWRDTLYRMGQEDQHLIISDVREIEGAVERNLAGFLSYRFAGVKESEEPRKSAPKASPIQRLRDWLIHRLDPTAPRSGRPNDSPPDPSDGSSGLHVKVSCQTLGLRLHVSPAYYINWAYFGSPTTPVTSYLLPGRYIFAGDGPIMPRRRRDSGVFSIPPTYTPHLTSF